MPNPSVTRSRSVARPTFQADSPAHVTSRKARIFWPLLSLLVLTDCSTKRLVEEHLSPGHPSREILGEVVQLTLAYNRGAAIGIHAGEWSRIVFTVLAI